VSETEAQRIWREAQERAEAQRRADAESIRRATERAQAALRAEQDRQQK
jgi:hypothetical protein